jgi:hypothetical protein
MMHAHALYSRWNTSLTTQVGYSGSKGGVEGHRWEWGVGKGAWKRRANSIAKERGMDGRVRAVWFILGSYYYWDITGTAGDARVLYDAIR